ncbi:OmpA family protein [Solitalea canadensis]|uniref:Outer membrane protein/peptidoglycan-associated (Lipo)protein n=1 Tax=Solitalea canadensis (strain ATCC 29591 / DSM 3403 / JCM 21819 / LMG 8368 / NBRC 15130 / NCIMB 12057 / USAM 9D) TaxID=929556 RepID=H8KQ44_SOLCM|nr:OmpA family protein [Solitalea canadensis]AFD06212.1 outer membrane protein/peptidoglycan-associated (lipo)protein [Solitalea canadensis DSM 3403]
MKKYILILTGLILISQSTLAQTGKSKGDEQYQLYNYSKAVVYYQDAYKDKKSYYLAHQIASCYHFMNDYKFAESWFAESVGYQDHSLEDELHYAEALRNNSKYGEAKQVYTTYAKKKNVSYDDQVIWIGSCDSALVWMKVPEPYNVVNQTGVNSLGSDWGLVKYKDQLVFCSDDKAKVKISNVNPFLSLDIVHKSLDKETYGWTGRGYLNIFTTNDGDSAIHPLFKDEDKRTYHIGSPCFNATGDEVFYTVTRLVKNPKNNFLVNKAYTVKLEIFSRTRSAGDWSKPVAFPYNNALEYSVGDPYITPNGKYLYFSSDMPGGLGGTDIYYCKRNLDGGWDAPQNLGVVINTAGNERFPRFSADDTFYFSSDGRIGMGGLDIYAAQTTDKGFGRPVSLKYPINSPQDDFAIWFTGDYTGYLSSNRDGGLGDDDIYLFSLKDIKIRLEGIVVDKKSGLPLENAVVVLQNVRTGEQYKYVSGKDGKFAFELGPKSNYKILASKTDYMSVGKEGITTEGINESCTLKERLELALDRITKDPIRIENIYYNFDKWDLRADALVELDKLVKLLKENPTIEIELGSHTDSRGNDNYNLKLSQRRAESVVNYLIKNGIDKGRLVAKGYGETQLINKCSNGVKCSEAEHQANRRTEFIIVRY